MSKFIIKNELSEKNKMELLEMYQHEWWSVGRTLKDIETIIDHSSFIICILDQEYNKLVAFSRILTDHFKFAYVYDVIVEREHRGTGLGDMLLNAISNHPILNNIGSIELICRKEMMPFYKKYGFSDDYGASVSMRRLNN